MTEVKLRNLSFNKGATGHFILLQTWMLTAWRGYTAMYNIETGSGTMKLHFYISAAFH